MRSASTWPQSIWPEGLRRVALLFAGYTDADYDSGVARLPNCWATRALDRKVSTGVDFVAS